MGRKRKQHEEQERTTYTRGYSWYDDDDDNDDVPEGCAACGGPYPRCCDACPLFDD